MTLTLTIHDRNGAELAFGDIVRLSGRSYGNGYTFDFYARVTYLPESHAIAPFHTFSFHSIEKVDCLPDNVNLCKLEERYDCWHVVYDHFSDDEDSIPKDKQAEQFDRYLIEWRDCESLLREKIFRIHYDGKQLNLDQSPEPVINNQQTLF